VKTARAVCAVVLLMSWPVAARAQSSFEPLDRWKAAVLANSQTALASFYSTAPLTQNETPQGKSQDASEEPRFWSAVAAQGLSDLQPKVLEILHPQPGVVELVLRIEFNLKTSSGVQPFVVEGAQVWGQEADGWRILATQRSDPEPNPPRRLPVPAKPNTDLYPPPEEAPSEISAALAKAAMDHKRVILVFGGNWCYDCHVLDATFHSKAIAPLVNANFHVVHVNIGEEYDKNLDLAAKYQVPLKKGVPALVVLDSDGKLVYSQQAGEFENSTRIGPADVTTFLKKWAPPRQN